MYMSPDEFPLPIEYRDMKFEGLLGVPPDDVGERVVVFLDCGNIDRMPVDFLKDDGLHIVNIDHHHDNTRFGTVNLVVAEASCDRRDRLRAGPRAGRRDHARDRRRACTWAWSPTPAASCTRTPRRPRTGWRRT